MISNKPAGMRAQREAGFRSHRVTACIRLGRRRRSRLSRRSGSASVIVSEEGMACGPKPPR
jgi:hypothetical protein